MARRARLLGSLRSPHGLLVAGFAVAIAAGAAALQVPWAQACTVGLVDSLFTATSAVCVTGLTVVNTGDAFTRFGQTIILVLIQLGGLGVMTFAAIFMIASGRRISLNTQAAVQGTLLQYDFARELRKALATILVLTFALEASGAGFLFAVMVRHEPVGQAAFSAVFHSVSAFCNAGFSTYRENLQRYATHPQVLVPVAMLVTAGGIGYPVLLEMWRRATRPRDSHTPLRWSLQTRLTIGVSAILLVTGALTLGVLGTGGDGGWGAAAFHSVSARTAGFNTVVMSSLPGASLVVLILLMFIGGSPGSCAGGIKTTTIAVWLAHLRARLRGTSAVRVLDRTVADALVDQAETLVALSILWNVAGVAILSATESAHLHATLRDIVFEQVSAFGTVGLSTGLTGSLSSAGKMWITLSMFIGRLGPLVVAMSLVAKKRSNVQYPSGRLMIG